MGLIIKYHNVYLLQLKELNCIPMSKCIEDNKQFLVVYYLVIDQGVQ